MSRTRTALIAGLALLAIVALTREPADAATPDATPTSLHAAFWDGSCGDISYQNSELTYPNRTAAEVCAVATDAAGDPLPDVQVTLYSSFVGLGATPAQAESMDHASVVVPTNSAGIALAYVSSETPGDGTVGSEIDPAQNPGLGLTTAVPGDYFLDSYYEDPLPPYAVALYPTGTNSNLPTLGRRSRRKYHAAVFDAYGNAMTGQHIVFHLTGPGRLSSAKGTTGDDTGAYPYADTMLTVTAAAAAGTTGTVRATDPAITDTSHDDCANELKYCNRDDWTVPAPAIRLMATGRLVRGSRATVRAVVSLAPGLRADTIPVHFRVNGGPARTIYTNQGGTAPLAIAVPRSGPVRRFTTVGR